MKRKTTPKEIASILNIKDDLSNPIELIDHLIQKEISACAGLIGVDIDELQAWIDLQIAVPAKIILTLLRVAKQYELDLLQEEVLLTQYDDHWQVSISVDGWIKLVNRHPAFAGMSFSESPQTDQGLPLWMECTIHRSDRSIPTTVREYLAEVINDSDIWKKMPRRILRHRVLQQCARLTMGIRPPESYLEAKNIIHERKKPECLVGYDQCAVPPQIKKMKSQSEKLKLFLNK